MTNNNQYLNYTGLQTLVANLKKKFVADASLTTTFADSSLKVTLGTSYLDESTANKTSSIIFKGDNVSISFNSDTSTATIAVANASTDASGVVKLASDILKDGTGVTTAGQVYAYVADQISALESALELKGSITTSEEAVAKLTTAAASKGDTYVVSLSSGTITYNGKTLENGDLVIVSANSSAGEVSKIIVVERNLDGAVTANAELSEDKVVLGAGAQGVKTSGLGLGTDNDALVAENTLATEKFVEKLANAAGGSLAGHKSGTGAVTIDLTSKETEATQGNLGSVVVKGNGYISVDFAESDGVKLSADTKAVKDATVDDNGLATAYDVSTTIKEAIEALDVTAFSAAAIDGSVLTVYGLKEEDGKIAIDDNQKVSFIDTRVASGVSISKIGDISDSSLNVQEALEYVYTKATTSGVTSFGNKTGEITVDTDATADGSVKFAMSDNKLTATVVYVDSTVAPVAESSGTYTFYNVKRGTDGKLAQDGSISELSPISESSINNLF